MGLLYLYSDNSLYSVLAANLSSRGLNGYCRGLMVTVPIYGMPFGQFAVVE